MRSPEPGGEGQRQHDWLRMAWKGLSWWGRSVILCLLAIVVLTALRGVFIPVLVVSGIVYVALRIRRRQEPPGGGERIGKGRR